MIKLYVKAQITVMKLRERLMKENGDVNVVSIVVLIGVAIVLAVFFKNQAKDLIGKLFTTLNSKADSAIN